MNDFDYQIIDEIKTDIATKCIRINTKQIEKENHIITYHLEITYKSENLNEIESILLTNPKLIQLKL